jgi:hypothetical protein
MKFTKKPVTIDAMQWNSPEDDHALSDFLGSWKWCRNTEGQPCISTLESGHGIVSAGDWVIRGVAGEFYPCKPDIFGKTYMAEAAHDGAMRIAAERQRQIDVEGWTPEHDDTEHSEGELAEAASCYADIAAFQAMAFKAGHSDVQPDTRRPLGWPWTITWWKPSKDPIRNLVKAGALLAAEIDRLQRMKA